jgi:hypothetical protein
MTSPDIAPSSSHVVTPSTTVAPNGATSAASRADVVASTTPKDASSPTSGGQLAKAAQNGNGGSLRQAVLELAASVECLCGESSVRDTAGAKRHLAETRRILGSMTRNGEAPRAATGSSPLPSIAGIRTGGAYGTAQDLQRAKP